MWATVEKAHANDQRRISEASQREHKSLRDAQWSMNRREEAGKYLAVFEGRTADQFKKTVSQYLEEVRYLKVRRVIEKKILHDRQAQSRIHQTDINTLPVSVKYQLKFWQSLGHCILFLTTNFLWIDSYAMCKLSRSRKKRLPRYGMRGKGVTNGWFISVE